MVGKKRQRSPTAADCPLTPPQVGNSSPPSSQQENDTCKPNQERRSSTSNASTADSTESPPAADSQAELQQPKRRALVWFRRDLRVHDNLALDAALQAQEQLQREEKQQMALLPVYILHRPTHVRCGPIRFQFLLESIEDLAETIADLKGRLRVLRGDAEQVLELVIAAWGVTDLFFEEAVMPYGVARDDRVRGIATSLGVQVTSLRGVTLYDPHEIIRRNDGHAPTDYERLLEITDNMPMPAHPLQTPAKLSHADRFDDDELLELMKDFCRDSDKDPHTFIYGGETKALRALDAFFEESQRVGLFQKPRTSPVSVDAPSTTSLSPYLTFGCLSAREFFNRIMFIQLQFQNRPGPTQVTLEGQLMWREFFYCYAAGVPHFDSQERNPLCKQIDWKLRDEEHVLKPESDHEEIVAKDADEKIALEHFQCWKEGRTGFPWIDAIMKQINQEGWTHHAGRHAAACFLTRGVLYISWLRGAAYFQEKLVDMDWPLNIGNWLWVSASTFFSEFRRVASPSTFPQRFDPEGKFVRKYIPALKNMPDKYVYEPWKASLKVQKTAGCLIGKDYPFPIVDAKLAIERCIAGMHRCYSDAEAGCTTSSARTNTPPPGSPNDMVYSYHTSGLSNATAPEVKLPN
ncbi:Cryptochrome-2 [Phytophthora boehmeriae]|uniref:Cryptochrome-2 n=1 Tax=Phytophthora boehmeriae TaxID=109152 RepID=A0A8T1WXE4_9STRA|nr:Cryptochrome-2 [Phytophthora boehmeriae]